MDRMYGNKKKKDHTIVNMPMNVQYLPEDYDKKKKKRKKKTKKIIKGSGEESSCFPREAKVQIEDGRHVPISHVTPGTSVLTLDPSGTPVYSPIYMQTHANPDAELECVSIRADANTLELSGGHFLVIIGGDGKRRDVTANNVKIGDVILIYDGAKQAFRQAPVTALECVERQGMYAPLTLQGSIVVDGVACSCYTNACRLAPATAHALLWPVRRLWELSPGGFALLTKPCDEEGRPAIAQWALQNILARLPTTGLI